MRHPSHHSAFAPVADEGGNSAPAGPVLYTMDPGHTEVIATWNHFGFSTPGATFYPVTGTLTYDADHPENSSVEATIPVESLHTTVAAQDEHLRSAEFFDAAQFPEIHFRSTAVERGAKQDRLKVTGELTVHGVTKSVTLDVTVNKVGYHQLYQAQAAGFDAVLQLNRSEFGIGAAVPMVSDRIDLRITAEAVESKAWAALQASRSA